ncbi:MAG: DsbA family protein [Nitrospirota bacterium]|nr:DsbA family protein [Nitrospirota bacterium]
MIQIAADYFTDPVCSWSWANEPVLRRLLCAYGHDMVIHHRMGGLLGSRDAAFVDAQNALSGPDPVQYREHQDEVCRGAQVPFDARVWDRHAPLSSYPACIAVKAAGLQGAGFEAAYLRRVREAFFTECRPVDSRDALLALAREVTGLDLERFAVEVDGPLARENFAADLVATRTPVPGARDVKTEPDGARRYGFPTMVLMNGVGDARVLDADHCFDDYRQSIQELAPDLVATQPPTPLEFLGRFGRVTTREVADCCGLDFDAARRQLEQLEKDGRVLGRPVAEHHMWRALP